MNQEGGDIIPGLPHDLALRCLAKLSHGHHGLLQSISKRWRDVVRSSEYSNFKARQGWCGNWLFILTEADNTHWIAYDPDADRWHPLPVTPRDNPNCHHYGFSCVTVCNKFLVIGGTYALNDPSLPHQTPLVTNHVLQFDPFKNQWSKLASMTTPRSHFACTVVRDKVYVAGGRSSSHTDGLLLAEVYDPLLNRWEELPPMSNPQKDCIGLAYKDRFHVFNDQVGLRDHNTSEVLNPSDRTWCSAENVWPFSKAMQFAVTVLGDDKVYTIVDWGESSIKTRDTEKGEWYNVGLVPPVILPKHERPLEAFAYGFAAIRKDLYVVGGKVLKWDKARFDIVKLNVARICDPTMVPLKWRETRPMCGLVRGTVMACCSMEE